MLLDVVHALVDFVWVVVVSGMVVLVLLLLCLCVIYLVGMGDFKFRIGSSLLLYHCRWRFDFLYKVPPLLHYRVRMGPMSVEDFGRF